MRYLFNDPSRIGLRRELRHRLTPAEAALWLLLQSSQLGKKFRRQYGAGRYVLDFYCPEERLAIELDGAWHFHENQMRYDQERTAWLNAHGIRVIRFENYLVFEHTDWVLRQIKLHFVTNCSPPNA